MPVLVLVHEPSRNPLMSSQPRRSSREDDGLIPTPSAVSAAVPRTNGTGSFKALSKTADEIFGRTPELQVLLEDEKPMFHEAGVFFPQDNVLFVTSNFIEEQGEKVTKISRISLSSARGGGGGGGGGEKVSAKAEIMQQANVTLPAGGINYKDGVVFCSQGSKKKAGGLAFVKVTPQGRCLESEMLLDRFYSREFNSPNDIAVHKDGSLWFTDPKYGSKQGIRPEATLPQQVYRFDPATKSVRAMADGFGRPNGVTFSPDQSILYVTDTDRVQGDGTEHLTRASTIYSFKVDMFNGEPSLSDRRLFAMADVGIPDGIKCDTKGNVYSGCGDGINIWSPGGELLGKILVQGGAANFCFGNPGEILCIFCRRLETTSHKCPQLLDGSPRETSSSDRSPWDAVTDFSPADATLLETLHQQPSSLCRRCSEYDAVNVIMTANPVIDNPFVTAAEKVGYLGRLTMPLGLLSSLHLTPSCPFCRLIYRLMPRTRIDPAEGGIHVIPFRSFFRQPGWILYSPDLKRQSSIMLKLEDVSRDNSLMDTARVPFLEGVDLTVRPRFFEGEAIALSSQQTRPDRTWQNGRYVNQLVDGRYLDFVRKAVAHCEQSHQACRRGDWPPKLSMIRVVDVSDRRVVPCPDDCDYLALSYVWGGVVPEDGALESASLPPTIEDAITLTKALGRRYLWVDALCIDQSPCLTAEEAAAKQEQLAMMHLIYQYATLTIITVSGKDSNHGLPGVSRRRFQLRESIQGCDLFTVPPIMNSEVHESQWETRAWTLQELHSSRRGIYVSASQMEYGCRMRVCAESMDDWQYYFEPQYTDRILQTPSPVRLDYYQISDLFFRDAQVLNPHLTCRVFSIMLGYYTEKNMSRDSDSLNAFLGILGLMEQRLFPRGFVCGLPLRSHPQFLGWMHSSECSPRRRPDFPSWSFAGWQGAVLMPKPCEETIVWDPKTSSFGENRQIDLGLRLVDVRKDATMIAVEGWVVDMEVRTEPLSEAFKPGGEDESLGCVQERDFGHNNTVPSGTYRCLTIQRHTDAHLQGKQSVILLLMDWHGEVATRRSSITLRLWLGKDFMSLEPRVETVWLQ
ncbi:hypothetical protein L249_0154 [Ophiocordyceps polyrhachis-furcata BCC 54312]|uniref:SMP-30/Gluconolactonase/LRE-like region domain-containing protein n=1 Tax=Ophiocordyceps polyrhachis-furcata BCC 54312 TaxID=1330021 RepID=A0A367LCS1_9HYPO|nr:hypothetical protein L249_0154 [Ophiocordyceps polyrhachis-furcata BCC 54312]